MNAQNAVLVAILALCIIALAYNRSRKEILFGLVTSTSISVYSRGISHATILTMKYGEVRLAFDTDAKIGCKHRWWFGRSQCFHDKGSELDALVRENCYIRVKIEKGMPDETRYVYCILKP